MIGSSSRNMLEFQVGKLGFVAFLGREHIDQLGGRQATFPHDKGERFRQAAAPA